MAKVFEHHGWRTGVKALFGIALTAAGFVLHGEIEDEKLRIASVVLFACGLLLTRYYGVQSGQIRALAREGRPTRLAHGSAAIFLRLLLALAAGGSSVWIWLNLEIEGWVRWVPVAGAVAGILLTLHFFRELLIRTAADEQAGGE